MSWQDRLIARSRTFPPQVIGGKARPYLFRWKLSFHPWGISRYLHHFKGSDDQRAAHDHPYLFNISVVLRGGYWELVPADRRNLSGPLRKIWRAPGSIVIRNWRAVHRIVMPRDGAEAWTLFICGPRIREWGFWCPQGWRHWKDFTDFNSGGDGNTVGPGCE